MKDGTSTPVLILGMHRSGTSYLAHRLGALGVDIGSALVGAQPGNPRGHFEDRAILEFHQDLIRSRRSDSGWAFDPDMMVEEPLPEPWSPEERARAMALIARRRDNARQPFWGWKEPRTALFIRQWRGLLPDMRGVVIFRHPLAVHFSALRRRHWDLALLPAQVLRACANYNRLLLEVIDEDPRHFLVVHADTAFRDLDRLDHELRDFLGLSARPAGALPEFHAGEFAQDAVPAEAESWLRRLLPDVMEVYDALNSRARIPAPRAAPVASRASWHLPPEVDDWEPHRRALLLPVLETIWFEAVHRGARLRQELAEEIGQKIRQTEAWNARAAQIHADNQRLDEERTRLGNAFAEQQAFLDRHTQDFTRLWEKHKELGDSWVRSNERVAAQAAHIRELEARLLEAGLEPPALPSACL